MSEFPSSLGSLVWGYRTLSISGKFGVIEKGKNEKPERRCAKIELFKEGHPCSQGGDRKSGYSCGICPIVIEDQDKMLKVVLSLTSDGYIGGEFDPYRRELSMFGMELKEPSGAKVDVFACNHDGKVDLRVRYRPKRRSLLQIIKHRP